MRASPRKVLLLMSVTCGVLVSSEAASASCLARPLVLLHSASRTTVKLPAFLRATMICGGDRGLRGLKGATGKAGVHGKAGVRGKAGTDGATGLAGPAGPTGAAGRNGVDGTNGSNGANGANGAVGQPGLAGTNGVNGTPGGTGQTGQNGQDGAPGQPGPAATIDYAYVYDMSGQTVAPDGSVTFNSDGIKTSGITHSAASSNVVLASAGTFKVEMSVLGSDQNQFGLFLNGVAIPGGTFGETGSDRQTNGQTIIVVTAGAVLTLRNETPATPITLNNQAGGTIPTVDASLLIERLA
jgi:hypothetical protein